MTVALQNYAPAFTQDEAVAWVEKLYGIGGTVEELPSERDQNFAIFTDREAYVFKIANGLEDADVLACQNAAMMRVAAATGKAPVIYELTGGGAIGQIADHAGATYCVRLVSYLSGKPLANVRPRTPELLAEIGGLFGQVDAALQGFEHPAAHRVLDWDLRRGHRIVAEGMHLLAPAKRARIEPWFAHFVAQVEPRLNKLRTGVIHGDGNDHNILVETGDWRYEPSGVIDFGDMVHSWLVAEPAIVAAYAMLEQADPLAAAAAVVRGYHARFPLVETEIDVLYELILLRLATSMVMAARQQAAAPTNGYLGVSQAPIWMLLQALQDVTPSLARAVFREACGLEPVPTRQAVLAWLDAQRPHLQPVTDADLQLDQAHVLDLSVGSSLFAADPATLAPAAVAALIQAELQSRDAAAAVGRYDEVRRFVTPAGPPDTGALHLGVDLICQPGTPIYAPLAGTVHYASAGDAGEWTVILQHATEQREPFFSIYRHLRAPRVVELEPGAPFAAGACIGVVSEVRCDAPLPPHVHVQLALDLLGLGAEFPATGTPALGPLWRTLCPDPNLLLGLADRCFPPYPLAPAEIFARRRRQLGRNLSISYRRPVQIVRGWRQYLYDQEGRVYLDGVNNVSHVGHSHPHVVEAMTRQMRVLNTNTRYLHDQLVRYAERLLAYFPAPLSVVYFVCSGSEANELALRLARTYTGRRDIIMLDAAYHGNTQTLVDISPYKHDGPGGAGAPAWAHEARMPDPYRGEHRGYSATAGAAYAEDVARLLRHHATADRHMAAFIAESVLGCGGQIVLPDGYLAAAYAHVRQAGGVCIADEVQVGFGRVGSHFWGFETQGVVPDIVTLGKPIGNGHPLGAVITTPAIADAFANGMEYFNTFGGNPVSCAVGAAVLDVIEAEGLQAHAADVGARLLDGLRELQARHALIGDVRGLGLFVGVELVLDRATRVPAPEHAAYIANRMRDEGIFISTDGPLHNVLKLKPPLPFDRNDADRLVATLDRILAEDCLQL